MLGAFRFLSFIDFPDGPGRERSSLFGAFPPAINLLCVRSKPAQSLFAVEDEREGA